ncbi:hypothetical protein Bbelb_285720 [Branchiostoma belcheri]|nr:hypothetical protein Bbelb_285720 [Branchiostoma belcheri]
MGVALKTFLAIFVTWVLVCSEVHSQKIPPGTVAIHLQGEWQLSQARMQAHLRQFVPYSRYGRSLMSDSTPYSRSGRQAVPYSRYGRQAAPYSRQAAPYSRYGRQAVPYSRYGRQAAPYSRYGRQAVPYSRQAAPYSRYGRQAVPYSRYGRQAVPYSRYGRQAVPYSRYGRQAVPYSRYGRQAVPYSRYGRQAVPYSRQAAPYSRYGRQAVPYSRYGRQAVPYSRYGRQAVPYSRYGRQAVPYSRQAVPYSRYGRQAVPYSRQAVPYSRYGRQAAPYSRYGRQAVPYSRYGRQAVPYSRYGRQAVPYSRQAAPYSRYGRQAVPYSRYGPSDTPTVEAVPSSPADPFKPTDSSQPIILSILRGIGDRSDSKCEDVLGRSCEVSSDCVGCFGLLECSQMSQNCVLKEFDAQQRRLAWQQRTAGLPTESQHAFPASTMKDWDGVDSCTPAADQLSWNPLAGVIIPCTVATDVLVSRLLEGCKHHTTSQLAKQDLYDILTAHGIEVMRMRFGGHRCCVTSDARLTYRLEATLKEARIKKAGFSPPWMEVPYLKEGCLLS